MEELVDRGWRPPVGRKVMVDEEMLLNIIDQLRLSVPREIREATELLAQRDRLLAKAQEDARRTIVQAREEADRMLDEDAVRAQARAQAEAMLSEARAHAARVIAGADSYAEEQLRDLERTVSELGRVIQRGLETLAERRAQWQAEEDVADQHPAAAEDGEEEAEALQSVDEAGATPGDGGIEA